MEMQSDIFEIGRNWVFQYYLDQHFVLKTQQSVRQSVCGLLLWRAVCEMLALHVIFVVHSVVLWLALWFCCQNDTASTVWKPSDNSLLFWLSGSILQKCYLTLIHVSKVCTIDSCWQTFSLIHSICNGWYVSVLVFLCPQNQLAVITVHICTKQIHTSALTQCKCHFLTGIFFCASFQFVASVC